MCCCSPRRPTGHSGCCCHGHGHTQQEECGHSCGCGESHESPHGFTRHYLTAEEQIEGLEEYLDQLEKEAQGVRERIAELKRTSIGNQSEGS